jgi:hypothetical protein
MEFFLCRRWAISKVKMPDPGGVLGVLFSEIPASFFTIRQVSWGKVKINNLLYIRSTLRGVYFGNTLP